MGQYRFGQRVLTISREDDRLFAQLSGQSRRRIFAEREESFFYKAFPAQITFELDATGRAKELVLHQHGREWPAPRID